MNIALVLRTLLHLDDHTFILRVFEELLFRQPNPGEVQVYLDLMANATTKLAVITGIMSSPEAWGHFNSAPRECLDSYEQSIHSQNGEDGILQELFSRIGETNRYFVEFGVEDGHQCNSYYRTAYHNWSGLMIEGNSDLYKRLKARLAPYPLVTAAHHFITRENITSIFADNKVPPEFDLLSIDIDGNDYWVWQALHRYKPRVVVMEYNAAYPPPRKMVVPYHPDFKWDGTSYYGASLSSLALLGEKLGYALIGTDSRGVNAFFVRQDILPLAGFPRMEPEQAYHPLRYGPGNYGHPYRGGPILEV